MRAFVIAMENEADCVIRRLADVRSSARFGRKVAVGTFAGEEIAVVIAGIGKDHAAAATQLALSEFHPEEVINVGVAGGLRQTLNPGELYAINRVVEYDFDLAKLNGTTIGTLNERQSPYIELPVAGTDLPLETLGTADRFVDTDEDAALLATFDVGLRDMEAASVAHVCETAGVRCRVFKAVSDVRGREGATIEQYARNLEKCFERLGDLPKFLAR